jgi:flagellar assembly protein FliH
VVLIKKKKLQNINFQAQTLKTSSPKLIISEDMIASDKQKLIAEFQFKLDLQRKEAEEEINLQLKRAQEEAQRIIELAEENKNQLDAYIEEEKSKLEFEKSQIPKMASEAKEKAFQEGVAQAELIVDQLADFLGHFQSIKRQVLDEAKEEIVSLALDLARNILSYESRIDQKALFHLVKNSIEKVASSEKGRLIISINPEDLTHKNELSKNLEAVLDTGVRLIFQKDENVELGSCILETQGGRFDARFSTQIEIIKEAFSKFLGQSITEVAPDNIEDLFPLELPEDFPDEPSDKELEALDKNIAAIYADIASEEDLRALLSEINKEEEEKKKKNLGKEKKEEKMMNPNIQNLDDFTSEESIMGFDESLALDSKKEKDTDSEICLEYEKDFDDIEQEEEELVVEEVEEDSNSVESSENFSFEEFKEDDFDESYDDEEGMNDPRFPEY